MKDLLQELNQSQREAVLFNEGPSLVIAGAGSGKTRVLTYKIVYLLQNGYTADRILALTFTNKAAREMKARIYSLVGYQTAKNLWMGTFHSIFSRILRAEAVLLGFTPQFTIYDSSDSKSLLKLIVKELQLDDKVYKASMIASRISYAKNNLLSPQAYRANTELMQMDVKSRVPEIQRIYSLYNQRCKSANVMDFDDLLLYTNILFRDFPEVLRKYKDAFQYILVDEYQDTNFAQHLIVKRLAENHQKVCVVGDDAQSIYSFRGANIDNILSFKTNYPNCRLFKLEQNYRSTQNIVNAANSLIEKNKGQIPKKVFSEKATGSLLKVFSVYTDYDEGFTVASAIADMHQDSKYPFLDFAVLYRTNAQSRILEEAMRKRNIPYRIYGGLSFYQRREIKDVLSYFRLVINPNDEEALKRIINVPARGIGDTTLHKVLTAAHQHNVSAWLVIDNPINYNLAINAGTASKLAGFRDLIKQFYEQATIADAYDIAEGVIRMSGLLNHIAGDSDAENISRADNIQELLKGIHEFCELRANEGDTSIYLHDFMSEVALLTDQDINDDDKNKVTLMTVHASKGLEFKNVFIVGMEDELFPSAQTTSSERDLEEERRLFYVAITRAEENCFISYAKSRFRNGNNNFSNPSRFIKDIDPAFMDLPADFSSQGNSIIAEPKVKYRARNPFGLSEKKSPSVVSNYSKRLTRLPVSSVSSESVPAIGDLYEGADILHSIFGKGQIIRLSGTGADARALVEFENVGKKDLLLKYAKLTVLK